MLKFTDALTKDAAEIERPPLMPVGTYRWMVEKVPEIQENVKDQWDIVNYPVRCVGAEDDVDPDALREFGSLNNVRQRVPFLFDKTDEAAFAKTEYAHKRFLEDTLRAEGTTIKELMSNAVNKQFLGAIRWKADRDNPELQYANIGKYAPIE
jgi:hypothetical protein